MDIKHSYPTLAKLLANKNRKLHHVLYVALICLFWTLYVYRSIKSPGDVLKVILYSGTYVIISYLNIYVLFKKYLLPGKIRQYILFSAGTFIVSYVIQHFIYFESWQHFRDELTPSWPLLVDMVINAITYYMFIGIGLSVKMLKLWMNSELKVLSLEQENLQARLNNLKSQVSPHFLFNTFNNLYVLTKTNHKLASEMILGFSDLMRYQLNESEKEKVAIENEVNYIENFLTLEKLRKDKLELKISYDNHNLNGIKIEPLLFVTLIENAVKHGSQQMDDPFIHVILLRNNGSFIIEVINSKPEFSTLGKEESLGKGLDNLKKRLNLSYPGKHSLDLLSEKNVFRAKLQLQLS
jgi:two-component system LytT family sensor kinase